jgi:predicted transcriptional regulator YdeE
MDIIPLDAFPLTGVSTTTKTTTTIEIPSTILVKVRDAFEKLVKFMEDMSLQGEETQKLQEEVKIPQDLKSMFQYSYHAEMHKSQRPSQELQKLQKETFMDKTLSEAKENIWMDVNKSMAEIWPFI